VPQSGVGGADPPLGDDGGGLGHHQPGPSGGELSEVDQVPVVGDAVGGRVLAHRGDPHPVGDEDVAQLDRFEEVAHTERESSGAPPHSPFFRELCHSSGSGVAFLRPEPVSGEGMGPRLPRASSAARWPTMSRSPWSGPAGSPSSVPQRTYSAPASWRAGSSTASRAAAGPAAALASSATGSPPETSALPAPPLPGRWRCRWSAPP